MARMRASRMLGWLGGGGGGGGRPASQSPPPPQPEQRQERPERPERPESLTVRIGRLHAALVASSDHGQRDALLELTRLLAEVEDEQGAEALRACQSVRIIERVVKLGAKYVREARAPGGDGYDAQLVLCCLANLAFFGGIAAIREAHGLDVRALTPSPLAARPPARAARRNSQRAPGGGRGVRPRGARATPTHPIVRWRSDGSRLRCGPPPAARSSY